MSSRHRLASIETVYRTRIGWAFETVDTLGLPHLADDKPVSLASVYVPLSVTWERGGKERLFMPAALKQSRRLVVLGDPGAGKSTLISVLAYSFGRNEPQPLARALGPHIPIPIFLRDYAVQLWQDPDDMLRDYCKRLDPKVQADVGPEWLLGVLREGRAALLIDGLDEVGDRQARVNLRNNVITPLLREAGDSLVVITSRIIGYDEAPVEAEPDAMENEGAASPPDLPPLLSKERVGVRHGVGLRRAYLAPLNDDEIDQFIARWYSVRERDDRVRESKVRSLGLAIRQNSAIRHLAGTPSLLTLMALIYRVTANLPSGRADLYDKITEAYLVSIQTQRGLKPFSASLDQMRRWLAEVGWQLQLRRSAPDRDNAAQGRNDGDTRGTPDILVGYGQLVEWLKAAIGEEPVRLPPDTPERFLEYVARRSGLLIPRGSKDDEEQYAFAHLTFQEYFAALKLRSWLRKFDFLSQKCGERMNDAHWTETLVLLFESLAEFTGAGDDLLLRIAESSGQAALLDAAFDLFTALLTDEQSGLGPVGIDMAIECCLRTVTTDYDYRAVKKFASLASLPDDMLEKYARPWFDKMIAEPIDTALSATDVLPAAAVLYRPRAEWARRNERCRAEGAADRLVRSLDGASLTPRERARCGRALSLLGDPRPGVGLRPDGLPDIVWCEVPAGEFVYGGGKGVFRIGPREVIRLGAFRIAKYPVTRAQFQAFLDAPDGYHNPEWWRGLHEDGLKQQQESPAEPYFPFDNHPRETVSWYEAMAFCAWLTAKFGYAVTLPTEQEWEKAARGSDGHAYPWGNEFDAAKCNTWESEIHAATAVGAFPAGASPCGALDMSGNVWEWTLTEYTNRESSNVSSNATRVLRGGSWYYDANDARAAFRYYGLPGGRNYDVGFRVASPAEL